ncbi:MAG: hypothetical protein GWN01_09735, partial [Nitrosopumilaceae archaeon]|nr:hypothetical protein [Nitrosopumilaceae archaeon]NIU87555.1 hypothetical protein [Nitrosopumilaceae archaeon]NIV66020.1 hypothetical protein [Nitrosopumilaceae archaeon]NIX61787.1 hypothetical protein [Nitrosopumilaceae archaeon]
MRTEQLEKSIEELKKSESWKDDIVNFVSGNITKPLSYVTSMMNQIQTGKLSRDDAVPVIETTLLKLEKDSAN